MMIGMDAKRYARGLWGRLARGALILAGAGLALIASPAQAQFIDQTCTASIMNRTVLVNPNGTFAIPNIPVDGGLYRLRVVCERPGATVDTGQSGFLSLVPNGTTDVGPILLGPVESAPISLGFVDPQRVFTFQGETHQLELVGQMPDGSQVDFDQVRIANPDFDDLYDPATDLDGDGIDGDVQTEQVVTETVSVPRMMPHQLR